MGNHPLEFILLGTSLLRVAGHILLFMLKVGDLVSARRSGVNGPVAYMKWDNIRHQGFMLAISVGMVILSVSAISNNEPPSPQVKTLLSGLIAFGVLGMLDAAFTYWRRGKLARLVAQYEVVNGGRREYDPPMAVKTPRQGDQQ